MAKHVASISMDPELVKSLSELAAVRRLSRSQLIEQICADFIAQEKMAVQVFGDPVVGAALQKAFMDPGVIGRLAAAMREGVSDEQMLLFEKAIAQSLAAVTAPSAKVMAKPASRRLPASRRKVKRVSK